MKRERSWVVILCTLGGGALFYFVAAVASCTWLWPESNLCGIGAVFFAAPLGMIVGATAGRWLSPPKRRADGR